MAQTKSMIFFEEIALLNMIYYTLIQIYNHVWSHKTFQ